jgi:ribonuclease P protein component
VGGTPGGPPGERFPASLRLRKRREFLRVQEAGFKVTAGPLLALALRGEGGPTRVGLTVSSKVGNAVTRVRIRRVLREVFRKRRAELPAGLDLVLVARPSAAEADFEKFQRAFGEVARRLGERFNGNAR